jgi:hypothetical protein
VGDDSLGHIACTDAGCVICTARKQAREDATGKPELTPTQATLEKIPQLKRKKKHGPRT